MGKFKTLASIAVCSAVVAVAPFAAHATTIRFAGPQTQQVHYFANGWIKDDANGVIYHTPHYMMTRRQAMQMHVHPNIQLTYGNGPVLETPHIYLIFWGYKASGDPNKLHKLLKLYATNVGGSKLENVAIQYYGQGHQFIANSPGWLKGVWNDNHAIPSNPTDGQVAAEAVSSIAKFGFDPNGSYVVATAHGHSISGFGTQFCAYHSDVNSSKGIISYTNLPYMPDAGGNCGSNIISPPNDETGADEGMTIVEGHELMESVTDPQPFSGWNSGQGEIGDLCAWTNILNDPFGTFSYTSQPEFSNATSSCVHTYP